MPDEVLRCCRVCDDRFGKFKPYLQHLGRHRHITGGKLPCGIRPCTRIFPTEGTLRNHLIRGHRLLIKFSSDTMRRLPLNEHCKFQCTNPACAAEFDTSREVITHLKNHILSGRTVRCPFPSCTSTFGLVGSLTGHISRQHRQPIEEQHTDEQCDVPDEMPTCPGPCDPVPDLLDPTSHKQSLADFLLKLEFKYLIPASTVQYIAKEMYQVQEQTFHSISSLAMKPYERDTERRKALENIASQCKKTYRTLRSSHCRLGFYKDNYLFVAPIPVPLGVGKCFYYVSIKQTLTKMMQSKSCIVDLNPPTLSEGGILRDYYDGSQYQSNEFFRINPKAFRIILFQDAFEPANPLGSGKGKHKMIGVYFSLGNIAEHLRTHPSSIQLVALCKDKDLQHDELFGRVAAELKQLESDGIDIPGHGIVKGGLLYVSGDNLGSHGLGGFVENFNSSRYFCRYCLADRRSFVTAEGHTMVYPTRTRDNYEVALRGRTVGQKKGVKFNSKLNDLQYFHVCGPGLPPCLGHDLLEGIASHDVALILHYLIQEEWFGYEDINRKIASFPYSSYDGSNKPIPFKQDYTSIRGKMWQIYNSIRLFPIMLAQYVQDTNHDCWKMLLLLGEILDIVTAPALHRSWVGYLQGLILEYIDLRVTMFPYIPLRPKHHYLSHYCEMILSFGPLGKVWTLRFESKHSFFKNCLRSSRCFVNVMYSCSNRHELYQAYLRAGGDTRCLVEIKKATPFQHALYSHEILDIVSRRVSLHSLQECTQAVIKGTAYKKGQILPLWQTQYDIHVTFGRLISILFSNDEQLYFLVEILKADFLPHCRAYRLSGKERLHCIPYNALPSYSPLHTYRYQGKLLVKLKHSLVTENADSN